MKKDIEFPKVKEVGIGISLEEKEGTKYWQAFLINNSEDLIETILICSKGFGSIEGKEKETATMRHHFPAMPPYSAQPFEGLIMELTSLTNEFWVSYYRNGKLYDKKFVFVAESISEENLINLPIIEQKGVLIL